MRQSKQKLAEQAGQEAAAEAQRRLVEAEADERNQDSYAHAIVMHCQRRINKAKCSRVAKTWVRIQYTGYLNKPLTMTYAYCDSCRDGDPRVIERLGPVEVTKKEKEVTCEDVQEG